MGFEYTGGREGTHSITMTKPIGGGVFDMQHVPLDQVNLYAANGYGQFDTDGLFPHTGYCLNTPDPGVPDGIECYPATVTPVLFQAAPTPSPAVQAASVQPQPTVLPHVGAGTDLFIAICVTVMILSLIKAWKLAKRK